MQLNLSRSFTHLNRVALSPAHSLTHNGPSIHYKWWTQYFKATSARFAQLVTYLK